MYKVTYSQQFYEPRLYELAKESGNIYTQTLIFFKKVLRKKGLWLSRQSLAKYIESKVERKLLHSQSFQASYQKLFDNLLAYSRALKAYKSPKGAHVSEYRNKINPSGFSGKPRLPKKRKYFQAIQFKKSSIRYKNNHIELSLSRGNEPIKIKWNENLPIPTFVTINWNKDKRYWQLNLVLEKEINKELLDVNNVLAIDLGLKRIATTYDSKASITYSGKVIKSLIIGRNKINSKTQIKLAKLKKGSRKYLKARKANKLVNLRIGNKLKDILHKASRTIINQAIKNNSGKIVIGDCSAIHKNTECGKKNNQQIQQNPEQILKKYIEYKFINIGGIVETLPENYTSQTCPKCCNRHKPQSRIYKCSKCGFKDDRDVVGAKNIYKVSFGLDIKSKLDVIGFLTKPIGWKYKTNRNCKIKHID